MITPFKHRHYPRQQPGQAYTEFLITFSVFMIFTWSIFGLAKMMDLDYSTQQARRYLGWQSEIIGNGNSLGGTAVDAADVERLFFKHPLFGYGNAAAPQVNSRWEDPTPGDRTTLPATLRFSNNAITLSNNEQIISDSAVINPAGNANFLGGPFVRDARYDTPTVTVNLEQVPYLMADDIVATNPLMLDQSLTPRVNPSATGGVINETLLPVDELALTDTIGPSPSNASMALTEFWLTTAGNFTQAVSGLTFELNFSFLFFNFNFQLIPPSYPFDELESVPAENFFDIIAPEQSIILPPNRIDVAAP